ncbi:hypothetical protein LX36DRAFT_432479 [Colletotrichum falcatum]|nr:hypothetical protein LX36DRAFT_432479 [Colletotrichum falcatum]
MDWPTYEAPQVPRSWHHRLFGAVWSFWGATTCGEVVSLSKGAAAIASVNSGQRCPGHNLPVLGLERLAPRGPRTASARWRISQTRFCQATEKPAVSQANCKGKPRQN